MFGTTKMMNQLDATLDNDEYWRHKMTDWYEYNKPWTWLYITMVIVLLGILCMIYTLTHIAVKVIG